MTFSILFSAISASRATWEEQAEQLRAGRSSMAKAQGLSATLGSRPAGAAQQYLLAWSAEAFAHSQAAQGRSDGLGRFVFGVVSIDEEAADDLRDVVRWQDRRGIHSMMSGVTLWSGRIS